MKRRRPRCAPTRSARGKGVGRAAAAGGPASIAATFKALDGEIATLDHVVTCAAIITAARTPGVTWEHWRRVLDINLLGTFFVVQQALARMVPRQRGTIVCVASDAGFRGGGGLIAHAAHAASQARVLSLGKSGPREMAGSGVRINALAPGP